jgi:hypothetical protein
MAKQTIYFGDTAHAVMQEYSGLRRIAKTADARWVREFANQLSDPPNRGTISERAKLVRLPEIEE